MEYLHLFIDIVLHLDRHLVELLAQYGSFIHVILFIVIFAETGLVVTPLLPGDSLLFAVGAIAANPESGLNVFVAGAVILIAAVIGDTVNYSVGKFAGVALSQKYPRLIKPEYLAKTHEFFERYGGKTIILARFVPIVRTFVPFVAGAASMPAPKFMTYNVIGGLAWTAVCVGAGFVFGNVPVVKLLALELSAIVVMLL